MLPCLRHGFSSFLSRNITRDRQMRLRVSCGRITSSIKPRAPATNGLNQTQADVFLALAQGQIEATVVTSTVAAATVKSNKFKDLEVGKDAPYDIDYVALIALRQEYGLLNYLNLFVHQQARTGRAQELYQKWVGGTLPDMTVKGTYR